MFSYTQGSPVQGFPANKDTHSRGSYVSKHSGSCLAQNSLSRACPHCSGSWGQGPRSSAHAQEGREMEAGGGTRLRRRIKSSCSEAKGVPAGRSRGARPQDHSMEFTGYPAPSGIRLANSPPELRPKVPWSKRAPDSTRVWPLGLESIP